MPFTLRRPGLVAAAVALSAALAPAAAQAACPTTPLSTPFSRFGDARQYSPVPGGHFENGTSGWSLSNAGVVSGNESYRVRSSSDAYALKIGPGGSATSPAFCVGVEHPTFRLFSRRDSGPYGVLRVSLVSSSGSPTVGVISSSGTAGTSWSPSASFLLAQALPIWGTMTTSVRVRFSVDSGSTPVAVDDVFYDPYRRS